MMIEITKITKNSAMIHLLFIKNPVIFERLDRASGDWCGASPNSVLANLKARRSACIVDVSLT